MPTMPVKMPPGPGLPGRILPRVIDNNYRGHRLALWLFVPVLAMKSAIALGTIFNGRSAAQSADGIPLDTFGAAGADAFVALFAIWGLSQLAICTFGVLALIRYRALIPFMFLLLVVEHVLRRVIFLVKPIVRTGAPPGLWINLALLALMIAGLVLSLRSRPDSMLQQWPPPRLPNVGSQG